MGGTSKLANFSPYEVKVWLTKIKIFIYILYLVIKK